MVCPGQRIWLLATSGPDGVAALQDYVAPGTKAAKLVSNMTCTTSSLRMMCMPTRLL